MSVNLNPAKVLPRSFYNQPSPQVAQQLLGKLLVRHVGQDVLAGKIVETEAYLAEGDAAAHNFKGKTKRNQVMFGPPGHAYVHQNRHHHLLDIVTEPINVPGSVLIRALEPVRGMEHMMVQRGVDDRHQLANGPAKLCQALQIDLHENGVDITTVHAGLYILEPTKLDPVQMIQTSPRIGISKATDLALRFFIAQNPYVSSPRNLLER